MTRSQFNRLLAKLQGPIGAAFRRAVAKSKSQASISKLVAAIEAGNIEQINYEAGVRMGMWSDLTERIRAAYGESGAVAAADLPSRYRVDFDINNPAAQSWLIANSSQLITGRLMPEQMGAIQQMLGHGFMKGKNPRQIALDIVGRINPATGKRSGGVIGLTEQQAQFVTNAMDDLNDFNDRYFTRKLRDKRFDPTVRASFEAGKPLPQATQNKIIQSYENRMMKLRGDTIARTETLSAINASGDQAVSQVVQEGLAPSNSIKRIWRHSFGKNERPGHVRMNGQERGLEEDFENPITGVPLLRPGDGPASEVVNCRCYLEFEIDFVAVERFAA